MKSDVPQPKFVIRDKDLPVVTPGSGDINKVIPTFSVHEPPDTMQRILPTRGDAAE